MELGGMEFGRMDRRTELTAFLRSRRARLDPDEVGVPVYGGRPRRVPGLRREELAALAGVSVDYYVRLEQGRAVNVSEAVLDAVARALRLDHDEREHLWRLARPPRAGARRPPLPQKVRPQLHYLLEAITDAAAYVIGRRTDVLAWNPLGAALIADLEMVPKSPAQLRPPAVHRRGPAKPVRRLAGQGPRPGRLFTFRRRPPPR